MPVIGDANKTVLEWLSDVGAKYEDGDLREVNHFHNPLRVWSNAGLWGNNFFWKSAVIWAQDSIHQSGWTSLQGGEQPYEGIMPPSDSSLIVDWSWPKTRDYFYSALTSESKPSRDSSFAKTFRGLGQQMHLLQDMSVPSHVRDNSHLISRGIEDWASTNISSVALLKNIAPVIDRPKVPLSSSINQLAPVARLFDADAYDGAAPVLMTNTSVGLAEWTNANFFSDDTINLPSVYGYQSTEFPFPNFGDTDNCEEPGYGQHCWIFLCALLLIY